MEILQGTCASGGMAQGHIKIIDGQSYTTKRYSIENVPSEINRFNKAVEKTKEQLGILYERALASAGEEEAEIFQIHLMMLEDGSITDCCESIIYEQGVNAEYAIEETAGIISAMLQDTKDDYMMGRTADVEDIKNGILSQLLGRHTKISLEENTIIFANDLTPSQTINLDKSKIVAFVTEKGAKNSHAAILARSMKIPSIVAVSGCMDNKFDGLECIVDAQTGKVSIAPDEKTKEEFLLHKEKVERREKTLLSLKGQKSITKSGKRIRLYANISSQEDLEQVIKNDAEGIGLFRSEFLYMGKDELPSEETQFDVYKNVLSKMREQEVVIRTLDIGADKTADCLNLTPEENPALGYRAIRICLDNKELFNTQLRALFRASLYGKLSIMFPMITSKDEVLNIVDMVKEVKEQLTEENIPYSNDVKIGVMIETPAAALISDEIAPLVDFFSIGTNDLVQYTLACDRQNEKIYKTYNPNHNAVKKLIKMTCENAHKAGIWVGVCGEMAADTKITETLIELGVDELSVSPPYILPVRESIINSK